MPSLAPGNRSCTACASTCAAECRMIIRPSPLASSTGSISPPSARAAVGGVPRSRGGELPKAQGVDLADLARGPLELGSRIVRHAAAQLGQDLIGPAAGGADQERVPEAVLVGGVRLLQRLGRARVRAH